jgi:hypothetical protein
MKNTDPSFVFVAAIVLAGVVAAVTNPLPTTAQPSAPIAEAAPHAPADAAVDESPVAPDLSISE